MNIEILQWLETPLVKKLILLSLVALTLYFIVVFAKRGVNRAIRTTENKYRARKTTNLIGYIAFIFSIIFIFSEHLGNLGVALGVTGAGIAFALQDVILSIAGWLTIVFTGKVSVGERVKIGELRGDIIDIGIMSTTFMEMGDWVKGDQYNGRIVSVANSYVFREKIQSYSSEYPFLWDEIDIPIRSESDYQLTEKIFNEIVNEVCGEYTKKSEDEWHALTNKFNVEQANVNPMITMVLDHNWITFTIRYIVDYKKRRSTKNKLFKRILQESDKHGDKIQIATSTLEVTMHGDGNTGKSQDSF